MPQNPAFFFGSSGSAGEKITRSAGLDCCPTSLCFDPDPTFRSPEDLTNDSMPQKEKLAVRAVTAMGAQTAIFQNVREVQLKNTQDADVFRGRRRREDDRREVTCWFLLGTIYEMVVAIEPKTERRRDKMAGGFVSFRPYMRLLVCFRRASLSGEGCNAFFWGPTRSREAEIRFELSPSFDATTPFWPI